MPRRTIQFTRGCYYHITNRGARRVSIFREARNYAYVIRLMRQVAQQCQLTILAYCLLPNHYHWLLRQDGDIAAGMLPRRVFGSYTQAYNRAYAEQGTLFQSTYHVSLVDSDDYMRSLCRYIHTNPVNHGLVATVDAWPYSNYHDWVSDPQVSSPESCVDMTFITQYFGSVAQYVAFVDEKPVDCTLPGSW